MDYFGINNSQKAHAASGASYQICSICNAVGPHARVPKKLQKTVRPDRTQLFKLFQPYVASAVQERVGLANGRDYGVLPNKVFR